MDRILQNLHDAHTILKEAPDETISLEYFGLKTDCGTLHCAVGWLAVHPRFEQELKLQWRTNATGKTFAILCRPPEEPTHLGRHDSYDWLSGIFGPAAFSRLFAPRRDGEFDDELDYTTAPSGPMTDKCLALWRIERQIEELKK